MPHYMDVHSNMHEVSLAEIEQAHLRDVEAQGRHGVRYHQFFHSAETGQVFCMAEAPSAQACLAVHVEANGLRPEAIVQVEPAMFQGFLGGGTVTELGVSLTAEGTPDTGWRAILFTDIVGSTRLTEDLGDRASVRLVEVHDDVVEEALTRSGGRRVKHTGDGLMASFVSAQAAVRCAADVQRELAAYRARPDALPLRLRVGIHVGQPVETRGDLFGLAVNTASRVCDAADADEILVSDEVVRQIDRVTPSVTSRGERQFKGISAPIGVFAVNWTA